MAGVAMLSCPLTSILRSTWALVFLGVVLNLGSAQPGICAPIAVVPEEQIELRLVALRAERLDRHTEYALQATVAAYTLIYGELPSSVDQLKPMLLFNYRFTKHNLDALIQRRYTNNPEGLSLRGSALREAEPFFSARPNQEKVVPAPKEPEFLLNLQVGLLCNAMTCDQQRYSSAPRDMDELAENWGGYNEAGWINPYTGEQMLRVATSVARTTEHAGDYAESIREDRLRILLYHRDQEGLSQPIMIWFNPSYVNPRNPDHVPHLQLTVTESMPDWELGSDFF